MLFDNKKERLGGSATKIYLGGLEINQVKFTKFLGVYIDEKLNWKCHITNIVSKISKMWVY